MTELPLTRIVDPGPKNQITSSKDTARYTRVKYEVLHVLPNTLGFVLELVHAELCTVLALLVTGAVIFEFILDDKQFLILGITLIFAAPSATPTTAGLITSSVSRVG